MCFTYHKHTCSEAFAEVAKLAAVLPVAERVRANSKAPHNAAKQAGQKSMESNQYPAKKEHEIEIFQEGIILLQNRLDWKVPAVKQSKIGVSVRRSSVQLRKYARRLPLWITLDGFCEG